MAASSSDSSAVDGVAYWLWRGGSETAACLELAQRLGCGSSAYGMNDENDPEHATAVLQADDSAAGVLTSATARWAANTVVCAETEDFRQLARTLPRKGWFCVDIGAAHGHATECLATACNDGGSEGGRVIGIEKGHEFYEAARMERPELEFQKLDVLAAPQYLLQLIEGANCVIVDINGVREIEALRALLGLVQREVKPSLLVVKSRKLYTSAMEWTVAESERSVAQRESQRAPGKRRRAAASLASSQQTEMPPQATARGSTQDIHCSGKCVALWIDSTKWSPWDNSSSHCVKSIATGQAGCMVGASEVNMFDKAPTVCPQGNRACLDPTCRNPNCGIGKRGKKSKAQAAKARAPSQLSKPPRTSMSLGMAEPPQMRSTRRYPLSYPRRFVRAGDGKDEIRICEFHNYDPVGCRKNAAGHCPLSHRFCHFCSEEGHRALECEVQLATDARAVAAMEL